tara:strand:+ start:1456 stop:3486 length:2031 start_codon:yes stop_codon:yes gene_type:complete
MDILHSKNINAGLVSAGGDVHLGDNYYKSAEYADIAKAIERLEKLVRLEENEQERLKYSMELEEEKNKLEDFKQSVISLAETFQKIEINTIRLQQAKVHFDNGEFKEAQAVLDVQKIGEQQDVLLQEQQTLTEKSNRNKKDLRNNSDEFLILAQLIEIDYGLKNRFKKAKEYYELSLRSDRNFDNTFHFASFLHKHNQIPEALPLYHEAIELHEKQKDHQEARLYYSNLAIILNNMGILFETNHEFEKSETFLEKALKIHEKLVDGAPEHHLPHISYVLSNLSVVQQKLLKFDDAEKNLKKALSINKQISKKGSEEYKSELASIFFNLGTLFLKKKKFNKSENYFNKSLSIYEGLSKKESHHFKPQIASTIYCLGVLLFEQNSIKDAIVKLHQSLSLRRELAINNPQLHLPHIADVLNALAIAQGVNQEFSQAKENYLEAIAIVGRLATYNPKSYLPPLATYQKNLAANVFTKTGDYDNAQRYHEYSLKNWLNLERSLNNKFFNNEIATSYKYIGNVFTLKEDPNTAEKFFTYSLDIWEYLLEENFDTHISDYIEAKSNLAIVQSQINKLDEAEQNFRMVLGHRLKMASEEPDAHSSELVTLTSIIAMFYYSNRSDTEKSLFYCGLTFLYASEYEDYNPDTTEAINLASQILRSLKIDKNKFLTDFKNIMAKHRAN